jgi:hypothetical protein
MFGPDQAVWRPAGRGAAHQLSAHRRDGLGARRGGRPRRSGLCRRRPGQQRDGGRQPRHRHRAGERLRARLHPRGCKLRSLQLRLYAGVRQAAAVQWPPRHSSAHKQKLVGTVSCTAARQLRQLRCNYVLYVNILPGILHTRDTDAGIRPPLRSASQGRRWASPPAWSPPSRARRRRRAPAAGKRPPRR